MGFNLWLEKKKVTGAQMLKAMVCLDLLYKFDLELKL